MVSLSLLLGAAAALIGSTVSAANLPHQRRAPAYAQTTIQTAEGNLTFTNQEYCRVSQQNARGWSTDGPLNMTIYKSPCPPGSNTSDSCIIERIATNIGPNDTVNWVVDVPVNITYVLVFEQASDILGQYMTTVPPSDGTDCDQSTLNLPFSAASLSNETGLIGRPVVYSGAGSVVEVARSHPAALAFVVAGVAAFL